VDLISAEKIVEIRTATVKSTQVWERLIFDKKLTLSMRMVHVMLKTLGERPGWQVTLNGLATITGMSRVHLSRIASQLRKYGYLESFRKKDASGKWVGWQWIIYPIPMAEFSKLQAASGSPM